MIFDRDRTLWAGYAVVGARHRAYFSGDTGLFPGMRDIGERLRRLFGNYATETGIKPRLEIEPGTFLVANCGSLVTSARTPGVARGPAAPLRP